MWKRVRGFIFLLSLVSNTLCLAGNSEHQNCMRLKKRMDDVALAVAKLHKDGLSIQTANELRAANYKLFKQLYHLCDVPLPEVTIGQACKKESEPLSDTGHQTDSSEVADKTDHQKSAEPDTHLIDFDIKSDASEEMIHLFILQRCFWKVCLLQVQL